MGFLKTHIRPRGPTEALGSRPVPTPAGMKNLVDLLLIQNILSPVSRGRVEVNQYLHLHQFLQIPEHFDQMRTLISGFLQQKSDRQPFFDYVASEAEKMTQEEFEDLKGRIFRDIEAVKNTHRHQVPKRSATITKESQRVGILPTTTQQASSSTQAAVPAVTSTTHPTPLALETLHQWSQYRTRAADTT